MKSELADTDLIIQNAEGAKVMNSIQFLTISCIKKSMSDTPTIPTLRGRHGRCHHCSNCQKGPCTQCDVCYINTLYLDELNLGQGQCIGNPCEAPIKLLVKDFVTIPKHARAWMVIHRTEQKAVPFKIVRGRIVDFRCHICGVLPQPKKANWSNLYDHYAVHHYKDELRGLYPSDKGCPFCPSKRKGAQLRRHIGQVHRAVEQFLPEEFRLPVKEEGKTSLVEHVPE